MDLRPQIFPHSVVKQDVGNPSFFWSKIIFDAYQKTLRKGKFWQETYSYVDLTSRVIIPFVFMIIFSILIIYTIFTSRSRMASNTRANRTFRKDVKFSLICIALNTSYIVFSLPISIITFFQFYWLYPFYKFFFLFFYITYMANFFLMFLANSLFREGFFSIFICSKTGRNTTNAAVRENIELQNRQNNRETN